MARAHRRLILSIVHTDRTFERFASGERESWAGKCIPSNAHLHVALDGEPISRATVEHILPRSHGGTDAPENLALACARCNHQKGRRHDVRRRGDPKLMQLVERLLEKRRERWREPEDA